MAIQTPDWVKSTVVKTYPRSLYSAAYKPGTPLTDTQCFRVELSASEFAQNCKALEESNRQFSRDTNDTGASWAGLRDSETALGVMRETVSKSALQDLQTASGKIDKPLTRGAIALKPTGSSYSMARVIIGHPIAAFRREKTKLPPLNLNLTLQAISTIEPSAIAASLARIIRAAWEYKLAGGIVSLKMNFYAGFALPNGGNRGLFVTLTLPLSNQSTIATFAGVQGYRIHILRLGRALSGKTGDGLPVTVTPYLPGAFPLTGNPSEDKKILEALRVR